AMELRPSLKFVKLAYFCCLLLAAAVGFALVTLQGIPQWAPWSLLLPGALLFFTMVRHVRLRMVKLGVAGDRLRYEEGLFSKTTRTIELAKVQDIRVDQSVWQRIFGIGDLSLETAGGSSRIEIDQIDRPQAAADHILELARAQRGEGPKVAGV